MTENSKEKLLARLGTTASSAALIAALFAQPVAAQEAEAQAEEDFTEIFIVNARKRVESILEIPASVALISEDILIAQGIQDFGDLAFAVPNVSIFENTNIAGRTGVTIRGIPGRAGIYVDDVFVGNDAGVNTLLVDIENLQVLRGPQGTIFGRNAMSGAINTVTRKPQDEFSAVVDLEIGEYDLLVARAAINGPITDKISAKLSGGYRLRDTYSSVRGQGRLRAEDGGIIQGQIRFTPTETVDIILNAEYLDETSENAGSDAVRDFGPGVFYGVAATDGDPNDRINPEQNVVNAADRELLNLWARADVDVGFATVTSITSYREIDFLFTRDADSSGFDYIRGSQPVDYDQFSQELRLTSNSDGPFEWMVGAYYFQSDEVSRDANTVGGDAFLAADPGFAPFSPPLFPGGQAGLVTPNILIANPILGMFDPTLGFLLNEFQTAGSADVGTTTTFQSSSIESLAFWATATFRPIEQVEITGGVRYTDETLGGSFGQDVTGNILPLFGQIPFAEVFLPDRSDDDVAFNASVTYFPGDDLSVYFTFAEGFRSGGYNLAPSGVPADPATEANSRAFDSETVRSYEIGVKSFLFGGTTAVNAAAFYSSYNDFQRGFLRATPSGFISETLNTSATIYGFELDATSQITEYFNLRASYGFQKSEYDDYPDAPVNSTQGLDIVDLTGQALPFTPKHSFAFGAVYNRPVFNNDWEVQLTTDVQFRSSYNVVDTNGLDPETSVGSTVLVNPSIGMVNENLGLSIVLRANNVFNEEFATGVDFNTFDGAVTQALSTPRVVSLRVRKDF